MSKPLTIYFDNNGSMLEHAKPWRVKQASAFSEDGEDFEDVLTFKRFGGVGSPRAYFYSERSKRKYSMFIDEFETAIQLRLFENNQIKGKFAYEKRGQAQAIKLRLTEEQAETAKQMNHDKWNF